VTARGTSPSPSFPASALPATPSPEAGDCPAGNGTSAITSTFLYGQGSDCPPILLRAGKTYHYLYDPRGNPALVVDTQTGTVVQSMRFDTFGRTVSDSNPGFQPFGFACGLTDPDTGFVHMATREYDPATGRFTSRDPAGFADGLTNLYAYVHNDPVNERDPSGLGATDRNLPYSELARRWGDEMGGLDTRMFRERDPATIARVLRRDDLTLQELTIIDHISTSITGVRGSILIEPTAGYWNRVGKSFVRLAAAVGLTAGVILYDAGKAFDQKLGVDVFAKIPTSTSGNTISDTGTFRTYTTSAASAAGTWSVIKGVWLGSFSGE